LLSDRIHAPNFPWTALDGTGRLVLIEYVPVNIASWTASTAWTVVFFFLRKEIQ
jgi:hypothetical protein